MFFPEQIGHKIKKKKLSKNCVGKVQDNRVMGI